jgi:hypothetical protein
MKTHRRNITVGIAISGLGAFLVGPVAMAQGLAVEPVRAAVPIEIDKAPLKIDVAAQVRDIDASLRRAKVERSAPGDVKVAAADPRGRG